MKLRLTQPSLLLLGLLVLPFSYLSAQSPPAQPPPAKSPPAQQSPVQQSPVQQSPVQQSPAQSPPSSAKKPVLPKHFNSDYQHELIFIDRAPTLLPKLYQEKKFEEIRGFLYNWRGSYLSSDELILAGELLVAIETNSFDKYIQPCESVSLLTAYARELKKARSADPAAFKYYINVNRMEPGVLSTVDYDASEHVRAILLFLQGWAQELMSSPTTSREELVFCRIIAGVTEDPMTEYKQHPQDFPRIAKADSVDKAGAKKTFEALRDGRMGNGSLFVGAWTPTGHLSRMGTFEVVGGSLGVRNRLNEIDINITLEFETHHSTPYVFRQNDSTYFSNYFLGGGLTADYTRWFVHKKRLDIGCLAGFGFISVDTYDKDNDPVLASIVYGGGLRMKYFYSRKGGCIDLIGRYNIMGLNSHGGTDLSGNALVLTAGISFF